jgi:hypothetical protein
LKKLSQEGAVPLVQLYVDLWQMGELRGAVLEEIKKKLAGAPLRAIEKIM